jgi:hypothetical protein
MDKVWGIVADAEKWYFMECTFDDERESHRLSYQNQWSLSILREIVRLMDRKVVM